MSPIAIVWLLASLIASAISQRTVSLDKTVANILYPSTRPKTTPDVDIENTQRFPQIAQEHGFKARAYTVITNDGYILQIFRMTGRNCSTNGTPVLVMHGFLQSADSWLDAGPNASLVYQLANSCYDVWIGNVRGTYYGRAHQTLNPDKDEAFWRYSLDEIGLYDVSAQIDYVLNTTGKNQLSYIGYSQGGGTLLILCTLKPEYNAKLSIFIGLAPATRLWNLRSFAIRFFVDSIQLAMKPNMEVLYRGSVTQTILNNLCRIRIATEGASNKVCNTLNDLLDSYHADAISAETLEREFAHFPAGASLQLLTHYGQLINSEMFHRYDYGADNMEIYGTLEAPEYDLSRVNVPSVIMNGLNDYVVVSKDVEWLVQRLPNVVAWIPNRDEMWNHLDMCYNRNLRIELYPVIEQFLG